MGERVDKQNFRLMDEISKVPRFDESFQDLEEVTLKDQTNCVAAFIVHDLTTPSRHENDITNFKLSHSECETLTHSSVT